MSQSGLYPSSEVNMGSVVSVCAHTGPWRVLQHFILVCTTFSSATYSPLQDILHRGVLFPRCFGHIMVTACALGDPGIVIAARMGSFYHFSDPLRYLGLCECTIVSISLFRASRPRTQREFCVFFCIIAALKL